VPLTGEYEPSPRKQTREQVERYEATDGREANTLAGTNWPVVIFTTRGRHSGKIRKFALMRVEHDGKYAMVASMGGAPTHPEWYSTGGRGTGNLVAAGRRGLSAVREVSREDRATDSGAVSRAKLARAAGDRRWQISHNRAE
jgi:deazaflavin-dependent oxidoreductase (nitroreductase family)